MTSLAVLLLALQASAAPAATPNVTPPVGHAPQVTVTAPPPDPAELTKTADEMQAMYDQTCAAREFGAYDDMCDGIRQQVRQARRAADKATRAAERHPKAAQPPG